MNILLVSPQTPMTFWSLKHAVRFMSRQAAFPPLGLLTVAAMLPKSWNLRLVDMDVTRLRDADLRWADYVLIGAMIVHKQSIDEEIIPRCKRLGRTIIGGGPLFTTGYEEYAGDDPRRVRRVRGDHRRCGSRHGVGRAQAEVRIDARLSGRHQDASAALGPDQRAALCDDADAVFARLPVRLRVLRHHRHERPQAAHQNARADDRASSTRCTRPAGSARRFLSTTTSSATRSW